MRVALIPTGQMELRGLADALAQAFPAHEFYTLARIPGVAGEPGEPFDGFTSTDVTPLLEPREVDTHIDRLVAALAAAVEPGRRRRDEQPNDYAVLIDDLELANAARPDRVTDAVRFAIERHLTRLDVGLRDRVRVALRERASFHLAAPMTEAWFFAGHDWSCLREAGVPEERLPPRLQPSSDPEQFTTDDPDYAADTGAACEALLQFATRKRRSPRIPWVCDARERHPKAYLQWLCRDPEQRRGCTTYRESHEGVAALEALDLRARVGASEHLQFARALINDLANALGETPLAGVEAAETSLARNLRSARVLRNI